MKKYIFLIVPMHCLYLSVTAQTVIVGNASATPKDPKAALEIQKTSNSKLNIRSNNYLDTAWLQFSNRNTSEQGSDFNIIAVREDGLYFNVTSDVEAFRNDSLLTLSATGNIGVGTKTPAAKLDVIGTVKITDGAQGLGKTLTSNTFGNASWQGAMAFSAIGTAPAISNFQLINTGVLTKVTIMNVEEHDDGGMYNPALTRATAPMDGWYSLDASLTYSLAEAGNYTFHVQKYSPAGALISTARRIVHEIAPGLTDQDIQLNISTNLYLLAGQYVELYTEQNSGVQQRITGSFFTWFNMHKIR